MFMSVSIAHVAIGYLSSVSVENHVGPIYVGSFCKANRITETPYICFIKIKKQHIIKK